MSSSDSESSTNSSGERLTTIEKHIQKAKEHLGPSSEDESDDSSDHTESSPEEDEDEDGEELTPAVDAALLRVLARIKNKDPEIYNAEQRVFDEEHGKSGSFVEKKSKNVKEASTSKPLTIRQANINAVLDNADQEELPTYTDSMAKLRDETIAAFNTKDTSDDDDDELLIPRVKAEEELEREEEEYRQFLQREVGGKKVLKNIMTITPENDPIPPSEDEVKPVKAKKRKRGELEADNQQFLVNYILNRGWIDKTSHQLPTYNDVTMEDSHDEEGFDDVADAFETSYNFRFEEPDATLIKSHPRNITSGVRRDDTTRKDARERKKERKQAEIAKKSEEVQTIKRVKIRSLKDKLKVLQKDGGKDIRNTDLARVLEDDEDWDPSKHDALMTSVYDGADVDLDVEEKPTWDDSEDEVEVRKAAKRAEKKERRKELRKKAKKQSNDDDGVDFNQMDAEAEQDDYEEEWDGTEEMRKRVLNKYLDDIYGLEFNDIIGGMPTRFKYTQVEADHYDLTPAEILSATDQQLNQYLSVKKLAPYRTKAKRWDPKKHDKLKEFKDAVVPRAQELFGNSATDRSDERPVKKRKGKKERMKAKDDTHHAAPTAVEPTSTLPEVTAVTSTKKKRRRQHKHNADLVLAES